MTRSTRVKLAAIVFAIAGLLASTGDAPGAVILNYSSTSGVAVNTSGQVTQWNDGATADNAAPVSGASGPDYAVAAISSTTTRPVLRFDGTNDLLGALKTVPASGSMFLVFNYSGGAVDRRLVGWEDSSVGQLGIGVAPDYFGSPAIFARQGSNVNTYDLHPGPGVGATFEVWGFTWGSTGVHLYRQIDGGAATWYDNNNGLSVLSGGIPLRIGGPGTGGSGRFQGDLAALRVYDTQLDAASVENEVAGLYNAYFQVGSLGPIPVDASMVTSDATFHPAGTPAGVGNPVPYGVANNTSDQGWILQGGGFTVDMGDFGIPIALERLRVWSSYPGGARGAVWDIQYSDDNVNWTTATEFPYATSFGGGWTSLAADGSFAGSQPADATGWYGIDFNPEGIQARYWRVVFDQVTNQQSPRSAEVLFFGVVPEPASFALIAFGGALLAAFGFRRRRSRKPALPPSPDCS